MITCAECGASASTAAIACPRCGAKRRAMIGSQPITPFGWAWRGVLAIIALLMVLTAWSGRNVPISNATSTADEKTPQEHTESNARLHSAMADVTILKRSLRDPSSLVLDRVLTSKLGDVVCIRYRARNGFGGTNLDGVVFTEDAEPSSSRRLWKKRCMHAGLINMTDEVTYALGSIGG